MRRKKEGSTIINMTSNVCTSSNKTRRSSHSPSAWSRSLALAALFVVAASLVETSLASVSYAPGSSCSDALPLEFDPVTEYEAGLGTYLYGGSYYYSFANSEIAQPCGGYSASSSTYDGSVWHVHTGVGMRVVVDTCIYSSYGATLMFVGNGTCGSLACVTASDNGCGSSMYGSKVNFYAAAGQTYYITTVNDESSAFAAVMLRARAPQWRVKSVTTPVVVGSNVTISLGSVGSDASHIDSVSFLAGSINCPIAAVDTDANTITCTLPESATPVSDADITVTSSVFLDATSNATITISEKTCVSGDGLATARAGGADPTPVAGALHATGALAAGAPAFTLPLSQSVNFSGDTAVEFWYRLLRNEASAGASLALLSQDFSLTAEISGDAATYSVDYNLGGDSVSSGSLPLDNDWHHLALVFDSVGSQVSLFVDGSESTAAVVESPPGPAGNDLEFFTANGLIAEVRLWDEALDAAAVAAAAASAVTGASPNLRAAYSFSAATGAATVVVGGSAVPVIDPAVAIIVCVTGDGDSPCSHDCVCSDNSRDRCTYCYSSEFDAQFSCATTAEAYYVTEVLSAHSFETAGESALALLDGPNAIFMDSLVIDPNITSSISWLSSWEVWEPHTGSETDLVIRFKTPMAMNALQVDNSGGDSVSAIYSVDLFNASAPETQLSYIASSDSFYNLTAVSDYVDTIRVIFDGSDVSSNYLKAVGAVNDACGVALDVPLGETVSVAADVGHTISPGNVTCGTADETALWFSFTAGSSGSVRVSGCRSDVDLEVSVFDSCDGSCVVSASVTTAGCVSDGTNAAVSVPTSEGAKYYVRVVPSGASDGDRVFLGVAENSAPVVGGGSAFIKTSSEDETAMWSMNLLSALPKRTRYRYGAARWSFEMWFKATETPSSPEVMAALEKHGAGFGPVFKLEYGHGSAKDRVLATVTYTTYSSLSDPLTSAPFMLQSPSLEVGTWTHIALVQTGDFASLEMFFDGESVAVLTDHELDAFDFDSYSELNRFLNVDRYGSGASYQECCCITAACFSKCAAYQQGSGSAHYLHVGAATGVYDEVRLWTSVRSQTEIADTMHTVLDGTATPSLVAYARFDADSRTLVNSALSVSAVSDAKFVASVCATSNLDGNWYSTAVPSFNASSPPLDHRTNITEDTSAVINLVGYDADGDSLTFNIVSVPEGIELCTLADSSDGACTTALVPPVALGPGVSQVLAVPGADVYGTYDVVYTSSDGVATSPPADFRLLVNGVNDPLTLVTDTADSVFIGDVALAIGLNCSDIDGDVADLSVTITNNFGTVTLASYVSLVFNTNTDSVLKFHGGYEHVTAALSTITYERLAANWDFNDTLSVVVTDQNDDQIGGRSSASLEFAIESVASIDPAATALSDLVEFTANTQKTLTVRTYDQFGNPSRSGGHDVDITICVGLCSAYNGSLPAALPATDRGDGRYTVKYTPSQTGLRDVRIWLNGVRIVGGDKTFLVAPAPTDASLSYVAENLTLANSPSLSFTIVSVDIFGEAQIVGGDEWYVIIHPSTEPTVVDNGDGTYTVTQSLSSGGTYSLEVFLVSDGANTAIAGSPFTLSIDVVCGDGQEPLEVSGSVYTCQSCPTGSVGSGLVPGQSCSVCDAGHYADDPATQCLNCSIGEYNPNTAQTICLSCDVGSFASQPGSTACEDCPCDSSTIDVASSEPGDCLCASGFYLAYHHARDATAADIQVDAECIAFEDKVAAAASGNNEDACTTVAAEEVPSPTRKNGYKLSQLQGKFKCCVPCLENAYCEGDLHRPEPEPGFWMGDDSLVVYSCDPPSACKENGKCSKGYKGERCSKCEDNHYRLGGECTKCGRVSAATLFVLVPFLIAFYVFYILMDGVDSNSPAGGIVTILLSFTQVISLFPSFRITWPSFITQFFAWFGVLNFNLDVAAPECLDADTFDYWTKNGLKLLVPFVLIWFAIFAVAIIGVYKYCRSDKTSSTSSSRSSASGGTPRKKRRRRADSNGDGGGSSKSRRVYVSDPSSVESLHFSDEYDEEVTDWKEEKSRLLQRFIAASFMTMTVTYTIVVSVVLDPLRCTRQPDGKQTMTSNPDIDCYSEEWWTNLPPTVIGGVVYVFGVPLIFVATLLWYRDRLEDDWVLRAVGGIYRNFGGGWYWWETCVMLRKALLVIIIVFVTDPIWQITASSLLILSALIAHVYARPYHLGAHNRLEFASLFVTFICLLCGILTETSSFSEDSNSRNISAITWVIIVIVLLAIVMFIHAAVVVAYWRFLRFWYEHFAEEQISDLESDYFVKIFGPHGSRSTWSNDLSAARDVESGEPGDIISPAADDEPEYSFRDTADESDADADVNAAGTGDDSGGGSGGGSGSGGSSGSGSGGSSSGSGGSGGSAGSAGSGSGGSSSGKGSSGGSSSGGGSGGSAGGGSGSGSSSSSSNSTH